MKLIWNGMKSIFTGRLMYSLTDSNEYLKDVVQTNSAGNEVMKFVSEISAPIYIYGAGRRGRRIPFLYPSKQYAGYIDRKESGELNGLPVLNIEKFVDTADLSKACVFISNETHDEDITNDLIECGVKQSSIFSLNKWYSTSSKDMYFDDRCLSADDRKCIHTFVDIGAFCGETTKSFLDWKKSLRGEETRVIAFEPMNENYLKCMQQVSGLENITVLNYAASDKDETNYISINNGESHISPESEKDSDCQMEKIQSVIADEILKEIDVDYIKMDVEGFEKKALHGLEQTIKRCHPYLAISVYHKREDIWQIPKLVLDMRDDYVFRLGHYTLGIGDTVLYAIPQKKK